MRQVVMLNDYLILYKEKAKKKINEQSLFVAPVDASNNLGKVAYGLDNLVGKIFYFGSKFERLIFEGQEAFLMKPDNLIAEVKYEEIQ
jgi:hypothetical protein